jgi:hypothetical protein
LATSLQEETVGTNGTNGRVTHLVGSIPAADGEAAMTLARDKLGSRLRWLPDGETGERFHWVINIIDGLREHPDLEVAKDGAWSDYDDTPRFRIRKGHVLQASSLDFGHVAAFNESYPVFERMKAQAGDPNLTFQVGLPGDFDMTALVLGPGGVLRHRRPFHDATVAEVARIHETGADDVVFQLEVPFELIFVARAPRPLRRLVARMLGRMVAKLAADSPAGTRFGVHLCLGDMNHKALVGMPDMSPVVLLSNAIAAAWPDGRRLEFLHAPFSGASEAPTLDERFYAPLSKLRIPDDTRFVAGFVYEHQPLAEQVQLLAVIEQAVGRKVDVSAACGLGRRSPEEATASMQRARELADVAS